MEKYKTINEYLNIIGWNKPELAYQLNVGVRTVSRWAGGQNDAPEAVLEWLDALANFHAELGQPVGWKWPVEPREARSA